MKILICMLCVCCVTAACTREDLSECNNPNVELNFSYTLNVLGQEQLSEEVQSIDVYVFDQSGLCVQHKRESNRRFDTTYGMQLHLYPGTYDCVAWANLDTKNYELTGNADNATFEVGKSYKKDALLHLRNEHGIVATDMANLFHGITTQLTVEYNAPQMYRRKIALTKDVNTINVELQFVGSVIQGGDLQIELDGQNGHMQFDNSVVSTLSPIIYRPYISTGGLNFTAEVLRLRMGLPLRIRIINPLTKETVLNEDLTGLILKTGDVKSNEDFDRIDIYNIVISFGVNIETTITINGWVVKQPDSDLG